MLCGEDQGGGGGGLTKRGSLFLTLFISRVQLYTNRNTLKKRVRHITFPLD